MALSSSGQDSGLSIRKRQGRNLQESPIKYDRRTRLRRVKQNGGMRVVEFIFFICLCSSVGQSIGFIPRRSLVQFQPQAPYGGKYVVLREWWRELLNQKLPLLYCGVEQLVACQSHKLKVAGSSPAPARDTKCYCHLHVVYLVFTNDRTKNFGCVRLIMQPKPPYNNGGDNNYGIYL